MTELTDLSETDSDNTTITGANVAENCPPSGINNAIRNLAGLIKRAFKTSIFRLRDSTDQTKLLALDLSGIASGTTRTLTVTDASGAILTTGSQPFSQASRGQVATNIGMLWEQVGSTVVVTSSVGQVDFTGISAYRELRLTLHDILPDTDAVSLLVQMGVGGVFNSTVGAYELQQLRGYNATTDASLSLTSPGFVLGPVVGNGTNEGAQAVCHISQFNQNRNAKLTSAGAYVTEAGLYVVFETAQRFFGTAVRDSLRVKFSSGTIAVGSRISLEGVRG